MGAADQVAKMEREGEGAQSRRGSERRPRGLRRQAPAPGTTPLYSGCSDLIWKVPGLMSVQSHPWLPEFEGRVRSGPDGRGTGGATEVPADRLPPATRRSVPAVYAVEEPEEELDGEKARGEQLLLKELALARGRMGVRESRERECVGDFSLRS
jgi:hypothetical protein